MKPLERDVSILEHIVAHSYGAVDAEITWEIITEDIPALKDFCRRVIENVL